MLQFIELFVPPVSGKNRLRLAGRFFYLTWCSGFWSRPGFSRILRITYIQCTNKASIKNMMCLFVNISFHCNCNAKFQIDICDLFHFDLACLVMCLVHKMWLINKQLWNDGFFKLFSALDTSPNKQFATRQHFEAVNLVMTHRIMAIGARMLNPKLDWLIMLKKVINNVKR